MTTETKATAILEKATAKLDELGVEYALVFGKNGDGDKFGKFAHSVHLNLELTIDHVNTLLMGLRQLRDEIETHGNRAPQEMCDKHGNFKFSAKVDLFHRVIHRCKWLLKRPAQKVLK